MALVTVSGVELPTPSEYIGLTVDLVDSGRNAQGDIVSDVIRSDIAKVTCKWKYLSRSDWAMVCSLFKNKWSNSVIFLNQVTDAYETRTMYVGDRKTGGLVSSGGRLIGYKDCELPLIEV